MDSTTNNFKDYSRTPLIAGGGEKGNLRRVGMSLDFHIFPVSIALVALGTISRYVAEIGSCQCVCVRGLYTHSLRMRFRASVCWIGTGQRMRGGKLTFPTIRSATKKIRQNSITNV